jgi:hypothetical protein
MRRTAARRLGEAEGEERAAARRAEGKIQKEKARVFTFHRFLLFYFSFTFMSFLTFFRFCLFFTVLNFDSLIFQLFYFHYVYCFQFHFSSKSPPVPFSPPRQFPIRPLISAILPFFFREKKN